MKKIGIVGHVLTGGNSFGITLPYVNFFSYFGEVILITPFDKEVRDLDLLVLPGGPDVAPWRYLEPGEDINFSTGAPCMYRERFDQVLLPKYIAQRTPIWGTCRGHQSLAVYFGAKIKQDMHHEQNTSSRKDLVHKIHCTDNVFEIPELSNQIFSVNSIHHQTVASVPENAVVLGYYAPKDVKVKEYTQEIEALSYLPNYPAITTQWHVEEIYDKFSVTCIHYLLTLKNN
jgi:gamma-glutamyl-gamma-aminobutyrate hydrolase PuuD